MILDIENKKLKKENFFLLMKDVCEGLIYLHSLKIIHMNLKPQNILIDGNKEYRGTITDFGISKIKSPFQNDQDFQVDLSHFLKSVKDGKRLPLDPSVPSGLKNIIGKSWHLNPEVRPDAKQLKQLIERYQSE